MAPTALEKAVHDRDSLSSNLDAMEKELLDNATVPLTEPEVNHLLAMVKTTQVDLIDVHKRIVHCTPPDLDVHSTEYQKLFKKALKQLSGFTGLKMKFPTAGSSGSSSKPPPSIPTDMKLPRLELPTFDGDLIGWVSFRDMFTSAVHDNATISKSQKFTYLKAQLKGEAARQLQSMIISDANYDIAWSQLSDRYQNDRELLFAIMRRFDNQPSVQSHSASSIRQLVDVSRECIRSLDVLTLPTDHWDAILLFYMVKKMDSQSKELWEQGLKNSAIPTLKSLFDFLEQRARALAASGVTPARSNNNNKSQNSNFVSGDKSRDKSRSLVHHTQSSSKCQVCEEGTHPLFKCSKFLGWTPSQRADAIKKANLCFNCLREGHQVSKCPSERTCRTCGHWHHTLLHRPKQPTSQVDSEIRDDTKPVVHLTSSSHPSIAEFNTMLPTIVVVVPDSSGTLRPCRALVDPGCNTHFVAESFIKKVGIPRKRIITSATGLGENTVCFAHGITQFTIMPHFDSSLSFFVSRCLVTTKVTGKLPSSLIDHSSWSHLHNLQLADPGFYKPQDVDLLLGAEFFFEVVEGGKRVGHSNSPIALQTSFGWLIGGGPCHVPQLKPQLHALLNNIGGSDKNSPVVVTTSGQDETLDNILLRFWEIDSVPTLRIHGAEELAAELHFKSTYTRDENGRFVVRLPLKSPSPALGSTYKMAHRRLLQLERRLQNNPVHKQEYINFMQEYENLGHMDKIESGNPDAANVSYIPHHFVLKESSSTTKFRVVFDASAKSTTGISLNDLLMVGPTIQDSLVDILIRFRLHRVAFTADIAKMYRQIKVSCQDTDLQRILWREDPSQPIKHYRLGTVTYGEAPAPFLAVRSVQQLAEDEKLSNPQASQVAKRDLYVDDLMSGEPSEKEALHTQAQLLDLMGSGGFSLRKWSSNSQVLLNALPVEMRETQQLLSFDQDPYIKTLGICWNPQKDEFVFKIDSIQQPNSKLTKRIVLSELARIFDPIGWLAPLIIHAKILMQSLWRLADGWDDELPIHIQQQWESFLMEVKGLVNLKINRFYFESSKITCPSLNMQFSPAFPVKFHLAGFCDASQKAYAATIYLCAYHEDKFSSVSLITSKTRVAPLKTISIPRLELCSALLLADLMTTVKPALHIPIHSIGAWTDSTVTLAWIQAHPARWKTFVANRVTKIQEQIPFESWGHVRSEDNPADCASRGISCDELINHSLWWHGPSWLQHEFPIPHPCPEIDSVDISEEENHAAKCHYVISESNQLLLERYSSLPKLLRVTAYIYRFIINTRKRNLCAQSLRSTRIQPIQPCELEKSLQYWIKLVQKQEFPEIKLILKQKPIPKQSKLCPLSPFVDSDGVLRVGGRLRHAEIPDDQKHPILLPSSNILTKRLVEYEHLRQLHAGPQLLLSVLQRQYWIIRAKDVIRYQIRSCVICTRLRAKTLQQIMADLPKFRVKPARPFLLCGVDYAGPFLHRPMQPRSKTTLKAYLCLFICCSTRAVHLELVSDLSTEAFLAAFRRFVSRRGLPSDMYSDCGTNFVGADHELQKFVNLDSHNQEMSKKMSIQGVKWNFNCPASPHFGGNWESGVKSVKFHMKRVIGMQRLNFEELTTLFCQIEACLNSRPLTPESSCPADLSALTPGHFLIGVPLTDVPNPDLQHLKINHLSRWQLLQQMTQSFWYRWSNEYLARLQQRPKWMTGDKGIEIGDLVTVKDENLPPMQWRLGRVIQLHPGSDGLTRVVTLKTAIGTIKRPIVKLCLLPITKLAAAQEDDDSTI